MHKKNELESMSSDELAALAKSLGVKVTSDQTELIYNIIDAESVQPVEEPEKKKKRAPKKTEKAEKTSETPAENKPKRGRPPKKKEGDDATDAEPRLHVVEVLGGNRTEERIIIDGDTNQASA